MARKQVPPVTDQNVFIMPKAFEVGGMTVVVKEDDDLYSSHGAFGMMDIDKGVLFMDSNLEGDTKAITFFHEKVHAILGTLGRKELNEDEEFVDSFANLLWQSMKTARY